MNKTWQADEAHLFQIIILGDARLVDGNDVTRTDRVPGETFGPFFIEPLPDYIRIIPRKQGRCVNEVIMVYGYGKAMLQYIGIGMESVRSVLAASFHLIDRKLILYCIISHA